ncbi:MAG: efflux RND transporter periplasmic adaptor subunit [Planctomycetes bacterium]|nr:efflux RND transporter periplasmic adaptor subunit [Planctomycetota bacterium]
MKKSKKRFLVIFSVLLAVGLVSGFGLLRRVQSSGERSTKDRVSPSLRQRHTASDSLRAETVFPVTTTQAVRGLMYEYLEINGDVITKTSVDVVSETSGKLTGILVNVGQYVRKDQVLAEVDPSKSCMEYALSKVKAPISGTITSIPGQVGATVSPSMTLAKIGKLDELQIRTDIAERFISKVTLGGGALLSFEAFPDATFEARVVEISPVVDPISRTLEIKLALLRPDHRVKSGMFAEIRLITETKETAVKVPSDAVMTRYGNSFVFVLGEDDRVERRTVSTGITMDGAVEIVDGLDSGEEVVVSGQTLLEHGVKVKVVNQETRSAG